MTVRVRQNWEAEKNHEKSSEGKAFWELFLLTTWNEFWEISWTALGEHKYCSPVGTQLSSLSGRREKAKWKIVSAFLTLFYLESC